MKFIKVKWFPLIIVVIAVLAIAFVLFCCGFRITYAPELENDWDAISAVATWTGTIVAVVSVIASFLAVWFAIQVPQKIAEQQNNISLFEKRMNCYNTLRKIKYFADMICKSEYQDVFVWQQFYWSIHDLLKNDKIHSFLYHTYERNLITENCLEEDVEILRNLLFLTPNMEEKKVDDVIEKFRELISILFFPPKNAPKDNSIFPELSQQKELFVNLFNIVYSDAINKLLLLLRIN